MYTDPGMLRQFCLWENFAVDHMEAIGRKVLQTRRRGLSKTKLNLAPGMHPDTSGDHDDYVTWLTEDEHKRIVSLYHNVMVVPPHPSALVDPNLAHVCRDPEDDSKDLFELTGAAGPDIAPLTGAVLDASEALWTSLKKTATDPIVLADINLCATMGGKRRGVAAYCRLKLHIDPQDVAGTIRKILLLPEVKQDGSVVQEHVANFDQFYNSATPAYITADGTIDYARFAKQLIVGVYVSSFSKGEQDLRVNKLADYSAKQMEYRWESCRANAA